jgi:cytochrome P450
VDELTAKVFDKEVIDCVREFARPLPVEVLAALFGLPSADLDLIRAWSDRLARNLDSDFTQADEELRAATAAIVEVSDYVGTFLGDRVRASGEDLVSRLVRLSMAERSRTTDLYRPQFFS